MCLYKEQGNLASFMYPLIKILFEQEPRLSLKRDSVQCQMTLMVGIDGGTLASTKGAEVSYKLGQSPPTLKFLYQLPMG